MNELYEAVEKCFSNDVVLADIEKTLRNEFLAAKARYKRVQDYPVIASNYMDHITSKTDLSKLNKRKDVLAFRIVFENGEEIYLDKNVVDNWFFDGVNDSEDADDTIYDASGVDIIRKGLVFKEGFLKLKLSILSHLYTVDGIESGQIDPNAIDRLTEKMDITHILLKLDKDSPSELSLLVPYVDRTDCPPISLTIPAVFENKSQFITYDDDYLYIQWLILK
ncbi:MAG: hypothetical protein ACK5HL_02870 [Bacilli bacterium]